MEERSRRKLKEALGDLNRCINSYVPSSSKERSVSFIAICKAFEVALEYAWKDLKKIIEDKGLEAYSPKDVVREAANINLIEDPEDWIDYINARNLSVHDYFSLTEKATVELINRFYNSATKLFK